MKQTVIGVDPDSDKHGIAYYLDGELLWLETWSLTDVINWLQVHHGDNQLWSIENVLSNTSIHKNNKWSKSERGIGEIGRRIGLNQGSQAALMQVLDAFKVPYVLQRPSKTWKETGAQKKQFEQVTGWRGRSNKDSRSAAYFGWLALRNKGKK